MKNLALTPGVMNTLNTLSRSLRNRILDAAMTYCLNGTMPENLSKSAMAILSLVIECSEIAQKKTEQEPAKERNPEREPVRQPKLPGSAKCRKLSHKALSMQN